MKTFGETLQSAREKKGQTPDSLQKKLHIPSEIIIDLEQGNHHNLPHQSYVRGYVQLLAQELQLDEEGLLALWRRDSLGKKEEKPLHTSRKRKRSFLLSPKRLSLFLFGILAVGGAFFVFLRWQKMNNPPELIITTPTNYEVLNSPVRVSGQTHPNNTILINTVPSSLDTRGRFEQELELPPGERVIVIKAQDSKGKETESVLFVTVSP